LIGIDFILVKFYFKSKNKIIRQRYPYHAFLGKYFTPNNFLSWMGCEALIVAIQCFE